jgi:dTDP-4-dehydrorhamnose reductase
VKWLVTGAYGMLGTDLVDLLRRDGQDVTATDIDTLDITDGAAVEAAVRDHQVVVNTAAWTAVDDAEQHEDRARTLNADAPRLLARAAGKHGARLVQLSTDYVFDGSASSPYAEDAPSSAASAYGRTKALGEEAVREELPGAHLLVRTAWLYGAHGPCFPRTMAKLVRSRDRVDVVDDQVGQPTWTRDVADVILRLVRAEAPAGTYHATSSGQTSWFGFARAIAAAAGVEPSVVQPTTSAEFVRPAPRPAYSVLGHAALVRLGLEPIGDWEERWAAAASGVLAEA